MYAATRQSRLHEMMGILVTAAAQHAEPPSLPVRAVVSQQDALTAVLRIAAAIDQVVQVGHLPRPQAERMAELLMVIRDYIKPLPAVPEGGDGGVDTVTQDLRAAVEELRRPHSQLEPHM
ncbi:MAG TPA: hypothetical protein VFU65_00640 [Actinocrinis sp.]|nr:hypothetical protein [Actinocrinis sp.]